MVTVTPDAEKFINDLLQKNNKVGYGIKIYLAGMACSGPQFGMSFQEKAAEGEKVIKQQGFDFFCDDETMRPSSPASSSSSMTPTSEPASRSATPTQRAASHAAADAPKPELMCGRPHILNFR